MKCVIVALSGGQVDDVRDCIAGAILPKAATNEIKDDPRFFSLPPEKVGESRDEQEDKIKVVDLEKVDFGKVDSKEQFDQEKEDGEDGKDCFEGSQVSESSESLSQVRIMM